MQKNKGKRFRHAATLALLFPSGYDNSIIIPPSSAIDKGITDCHCVFLAFLKGCLGHGCQGFGLLTSHFDLCMRAPSLYLSRAFSPGLKERFSSAKFLVDLSVLYARRPYTHQSFSTRKISVPVSQPRG